MKELTMQEKAKAYDEVLSKVANCSTDKYGCLIDIKPSDLFPELKESEDKKIRRAIIEHFADSHSSMYPYKGFTKEQILAWLEKKGEQKPVEWSEEDEDVMNTLIKYLTLECDKTPIPEDKEMFDREISMLKSLKGRVQPQNTLKPSDEQMEALDIAIDEIRSMKTAAGDEVANALSSLYEQLKAL